MAVPVVVSTSTYTPPNPGTYVGQRSPAQWGLTVPNVANRCAIVWAADVCGFPVSATLDDVAMIPLHIANDNYSLFGWYLIDPPIGTPQIKVYFGFLNNDVYEFAGAAACLDLVDPVSRHNIVVRAASLTSPITISPVIGTEELAVACLHSQGVATPDPSQTEVAQVTGTNFGLSRLSVCTKESGSFSWTTSFGNSAVIAVSFKPVGAPGDPPLPCLELFDELMLIAGTTHCGHVQSNFDNYQIDGIGGVGVTNTISPAGTQGSEFYSGTMVLYSIGEYRSEGAPWTVAAAQMAEMICVGFYVPNGGVVPGWHFFTDGLVKDFEIRANTTSRDSVPLLRDHSAWQADGIDMGPSVAYATPPGDLAGDMLNREVAYLIDTHLDCLQLGISPRTTKYNELIGFAYDYFNFWVTNEEWVGLNLIVQPFYIGLLLKAIIRDHDELSADARCVGVVEATCDWLWDNYWLPEGLGFGLQVNPATTDGASTEAASVLNNLITSAFYWAGLHTGRQDLIDKGDMLFAGSAVNNGTQIGKQFNQQHWWTFQGLAYRAAFYARDANPIQFYLNEQAGMAGGMHKT